MKNAILASSALLAGIIVGAFSASAAAHQHEGDVIIGRTGSGQLRFEADLDEIHLLEPVAGLLQGWAGDEPGFEALAEDEPDEDFFRLGTGAQIWLEAVALDPALRVHNPLNPLLMLSAPGDRLPLGDHELHDHVIWHVDPLDPAFDPGRSIWQGTFKLVDTGPTGYSDSPLLTLRFAIPEPGTFALLVAGSLAVLRRPATRGAGMRRR